MNEANYSLNQPCTLMHLEREHTVSYGDFLQPYAGATWPIGKRDQPWELALGNGSYHQVLMRVMGQLLGTGHKYIYMSL